MIRRVIFMLAFLGLYLIPVDLLAQNFYTSFNFGYAAPMAQQNVEEFIDFEISPSLSGFTFEENKLSFGQGIQSKLGFGWRWTEQVSLELNLSYLLSKEFESTTEDNFSRSWTLKGRIFSLIPSLVYRAPIDDSKFEYYSRVGLIIGLAPSIVERIKISHPIQGEAAEMSLFHGSQAIGFNGAMGVSLRINKMVLFAEIDFRALSYSPTKKTLKESSVNGQSNIAIFSSSDKETVFLESLGGGSDPNGPQEALIESYSFSGIGLNIGVSYDLF